MINCKFTIYIEEHIVMCYLFFTARGLLSIAEKFSIRRQSGRSVDVYCALVSTESSHCRWAFLRPEQDFRMFACLGELGAEDRLRFETCEGYNEGKTI